MRKLTTHSHPGTHSLRIRRLVWATAMPPINFGELLPQRERPLTTHSYPGDHGLRIPRLVCYGSTLANLLPMGPALPI